MFKKQIPKINFIKSQHLYKFHISTGRKRLSTQPMTDSIVLHTRILELRIYKTSQRDHDSSRLHKIYQPREGFEDELRNRNGIDNFS